MVNALSGTGKTTTGLWGLGVRVPKDMKVSDEQKEIIKMMRTFKGSQAAMAFNRSIADELKARVPVGCKADTSNAFGHQAWTRFVGSRPNVDGLKNRKLCSEYIQNIPFKERMGIEIAVDELVRLCKCYMFDPTIQSNDNWLEGDRWSDGIGALMWLAERFCLDTTPQILELAQKVFEKGVNMKTYIDFDDQIFLPLYYDVPLPKYGHLLIDETQDLGRSKQELALKMGEVLTAIGDRHQCQPEGTKITICSKLGNRFNSAVFTIKDISCVKVGDSVVAFSTKEESYVSNAIVDAVSSRRYKGRMYSITCNEKTTKCTSNHKFVVRWNSVPTDLWCTYIMKKGKKFRVGWCQLFNINGEFHLGMRARIEEAECAWIVRLHTSKIEASMYEQQLSISYGVSTVMFKAAGNAEIYTQEALDKFWEWDVKNKNYNNAETLLKEHQLRLDTPFYVHGTARKKGVTTMFELAACNMAIVQEYIVLPSTSIIDSNRLKRWDKVTIESELYSGKVYSLSVAKHGTYIADGVCTHNSIYGFSGADSDAMDNLYSRMGEDAVELPLNTTRRCPVSVVKLAQKIVPSLKAAPGAIEGTVEYLKNEEFITSFNKGLEACMILSRTNAPLTALAFRMLAKGIRCFIQGRDIGRGIKTEIKKTGATELNAALTKVHDRIDKKRLEIASREFPDENQLEALSDKWNCIETIGNSVDTLNEFYNKVDELFKDSGRDTDIRLSSCHKSKGLEHKRVYIYGNEALGRKGKKKFDYQQEKNLQYVAYTRSMDYLGLVSQPERQAFGSVED